MKKNTVLLTKKKKKERNQIKFIEGVREGPSHGKKFNPKRKVSHGDTLLRDK